MVIDVSFPPPARLGLGRQGETGVTSVAFDITPWVEELGTGQLQLVAKRATENVPYPVELDGNVWAVSDIDTGIAGYGEAQLIYLIDGAVKKSLIFSTLVLRSLDDAGDVPDPYEPWLDAVLDARDDAEQAAEAASGYATDAAASAAEAAEYKINFTDDGDGNVVIARSE